MYDPTITNLAVYFTVASAVMFVMGVLYIIYSNRRLYRHGKRKK